MPASLLFPPLHISLLANLIYFDRATPCIGIIIIYPESNRFHKFILANKGCWVIGPD